MSFRANKTKIVCTIGPATASFEMMCQMIEAGMNIARLNYSHADFATHAKAIKNLRRAEKKTGIHITIMADLPGPKIRIGALLEESFILNPGDQIILTTQPLIGDWTRVSVSLPELPQAVREGDIIFLNDGRIQLRVISVTGTEILCNIIVGGELRANKGLNLPGIDLGISAFTKHDAACLKSALENGVDAISQSFVNNAEDMLAVRDSAKALGYDPFIIAKMERSGALDKIDEILAVSDGMMIARGDLGVEIPIEQLAIVQKRLIARANLMRKPVITATQMLESMVRNPRPTRAEATDVANAVLDGTDCLMLSEESAIGSYPLDAVRTLAKIAEYTENHRNHADKIKHFPDFSSDNLPSITDTIAHDVFYAAVNLKPQLLVAHTVSGHTARMISRFKLEVWILAVSSSYNVCQGLRFSFGVKPLLVKKTPKDWKKLIKEQIQCHKLTNGVALLVEVPSAENPEINHRLEIFSDISLLCQ